MPKKSQTVSRVSALLAIDRVSTRLELAHIKPIGEDEFAEMAEELRQAAESFASVFRAVLEALET